MHVVVVMRVVRTPHLDVERIVLLPSTCSAMNDFTLVPSGSCAANVRPASCAPRSFRDHGLRSAPNSRFMIS